MNAHLVAALLLLTASVSAAAAGSEMRAIKVRIPDNADTMWIEGTLDRISKAHFNTVVLETFYHGYTIFPSKMAERAGIIPQRPAFKDWDPLDVFLKESHKREIAVQAWVETFYVGNDQVEGPGPVLAAHPEWALRRKNGEMRATDAEKTYYFLCPANEGSRRYIGDIYVEIARKYPIDGLFIDYLRYPVKSIGPEDPFCYCDTCRKKVKEDLSCELSDIRPDPGDEMFRKWTAWREEQTTETMRYLSKRLRKDAPDVPIIGNVHGGYNPDLMAHDTLRDWVKWVREGLVDVISTQNYSSDDAGVEEQMKRDVSFLPEGTQFWPAINIKEVDTGCHQLASARRLTDLGVAYFVYTWLTNERIEALARGPLKERVSPPDRQNLLLLRPKSK